MKAEEYLKHWKTVKHVRVLGCQKHQRRLQTCASFMQGETFVDVGCGFGHSTAHLKKFHPGCWTGIDFSSEMIEIADQTFPELSFIFVDSIANLVAAGRYDGVVCSEVIEHVEDPQLLLDRLIEITRKTLIVTTPCHRVVDPGHVRLYTRETLADLMKLKPQTWGIDQDADFFYLKVKNG